MSPMWVPHDDIEPDLKDLITCQGYPSSRPLVSTDAARAVAEAMRVLEFAVHTPKEAETDE